VLSKNVEPLLELPVQAFLFRFRRAQQGDA